MTNFTVGPVQSEESVLKIGGSQVPYFRTPEFSKIMKENERLILKFACAPTSSRAAFMTCSGTGSMESTIINVLNKSDKAIVINGGSFGNRFVELLKLHKISHTEIKLKPGTVLLKEHLNKFSHKGYSAFIVNVHETSTGIHYDMNLISKFCKENHLILIVDAISSFLADELNMKKLGVDVMITGSQKALACPPGVSIIVLSPKALKRVYSSRTKCMYLDLKLALNNGERGQTPFTPAVGILLQINKRLKEIEKHGGVASEVERTGLLASYFRKKIKDLPFKIFSKSLSNAVTPLLSENMSAYSIFNILKDKYNIWVCPNSGELKDKVFRVGHIGNLKKSDYDKLLIALEAITKNK